MKCFGVPAALPCCAHHAGQAAGDAEQGVENKLDCFNTEMRINPRLEQEAERSPVLPATASLRSVSPSWGGSSAELLTVLSPSIVPCHRNLEVLREEEKKKRKNCCTQEKIQ